MTITTGHPAHACGGALRGSHGCNCPEASGAAASHAEIGGMGATALLGADLGSSDVIDDPRVAQALGKDPRSLSDADQELLRRLVGPDVAAQTSYADDLDEILESYEDFGNNYDLGDAARVGALLAASYDHEMTFDLDYSGDYGVESYTVGHYAKGFGMVAETSDSKYLSVDRYFDGDREATGLEKAMRIAENLDSDYRRCLLKAKRNALTDIDMAGTPGMGERARRIPASQVPFMLTKGGRYRQVAIDDKGEWMSGLSHNVTVTDITDSQISVLYRDNNGGGVLTGNKTFATDKSGHVYVLGYTGKPEIAFVALD